MLSVALNSRQRINNKNYSTKLTFIVWLSLSLLSYNVPDAWIVLQEDISLKSLKIVMKTVTGIETIIHSGISKQQTKIVALRIKFIFFL